MSKPSPLNEEEQADLVAYLDGELEADTARQLEARLGREPTVRAEADALKQAWDLLDYLPKPEPSPNFTHRTMERVSPIRQTASQTYANPSGGNVGWTLLLGVGWAGCLIVAWLLGSAAYDHLVPPPAPPPTPTPEKDAAKPVRLSDFTPEVQTFVNEQLLPQLSTEEKDHLTKLEGKWPNYAHALLKTAGKHEVLPPVYNTGGVTTYFTLPKDWQTAMPKQRMNKEGHWNAIKQAEGKWPQFALTMTDIASKERPKLKTANLPPLGACRPKEFSPAVQLFLDEKLRPVLSDAEKKKLDDTAGKWPEYPRLLVNLASQHQLVVPGMMMPEF